MAVAWYQLWRRQGLVGAMVHGDKVLPERVSASRDDAALRVLALLVAGTSAGVAVWDGVETETALVARADAAMYRAKEAGKNRVMPAEEGA